MGTKLGIAPSDEGELNRILQRLYSDVKNNKEKDKPNNFTGLLEVISSESNIVSAIHKIKANKGSKTAGVDSKTMRDYLKKYYEEVILEVQNKLQRYEPKN